MSDKINNSEFTKSILDALKKSAAEGGARNERYEKVYELERKKWPHGMGTKKRSEIPSELHQELDQCISQSQLKARTACQTIELTDKYLRENV